MKGKNMKGATFYIVFGKRGSYGFFKDGPSIRFSLGWVAICFSWIDLETAMQNSTSYIRLLKRKIANQAPDAGTKYSGDPDKNPRKDVDIFHAPML